MTMAEQIRVLIADDSADTRELVKKLIDLSERLVLFGEAGSGEEVLDQLKSGLPDIVLMDINMPGINGLETTERISRLYPSLLVVMMSVQAETEYLRKAMTSGAREYLIKPFNMEVMEDTLCTTFDKDLERQKQIRQREEQTHFQGTSKMHVFFSTKGGVGKSVIALNTAIALNERKAGNVALLDLDLQFGDMGILINKKPSKTIYEAMEDNALGDPELLTGYMEKCDGVDVLLAPRKPEMAEYITEAHIQTLIKTLKKIYKFVLVDVSVSFNEIALSALEQADHIHFTTTMDLLSLKNTRLGLEVLRSLHYSDKVDVLINRGGKGADITVQDVDKALGIKTLMLIPEEEKAVLDSVNRGVPFVSDRKYKGNRAAKAIQQLADQIKTM